MKNKKVLIGIICVSVLAIIIVIIGLLLGNAPAKDEKEKTPTEIKQLNAKRTFEGFEFVDATIQQNGEKYEFVANITAKESKASYTRVAIWYYDSEEKEVGAAICALPQLNAEETVSFSCSTDNNILNAVDYKVVATDKEISELKQS